MDGIKVLVVYNLTEWQVDVPEAFLDLIQGVKDIRLAMRVDPIGTDDQGRAYWHFHGKLTQRVCTYVTPEP